MAFQFFITLAHWSIQVTFCIFTCQRLCQSTRQSVRKATARYYTVDRRVAPVTVKIEAQYALREPPALPAVHLQSCFAHSQLAFFYAVLQGPVLTKQCLRHLQEQLAYWVPELSQLQLYLLKTSCGLDALGATTHHSRRVRTAHYSRPNPTLDL